MTKRNQHDVHGQWKRLGRVGVAAAAALALSVGLAACAPASDSGPAEPDATGIEGKNISYISFGQQYEFIVGLTLSITETLEAAGANVTVLDGKSDPNLQTTQIQDALATQPDALIVDPVDPTLMISGFEDAAAAGVPMFVVETLPEGVEFTGFVGYNSVGAGELGAETLSALINGSGTVLQLRGAEGSQQAQLRGQGFDEGMMNYPDITVVDLKTEWTAENANAMVLDAFTRDPNIVGIWSHNDEMLRGAYEALEVLGIGPDQVASVGHDGTPLAMQRIRDGIQDATVAYDAIGMGQLISEKIIAYFSGEDFEQTTILEPYLVELANVDDSSNWGNLPALN